MEQHKSPVWPIIGLMFVAAVAWRGYVAFKPKLTAAARPAVPLEKILNGEVQPIPGPSLTEGSPDALKFEKIDLGIGSVQSISETGDILYAWYGDKPVEFAYKDSDGFMRTGIRPAPPVRRVRKANGTIIDFPKGVETIQTRGGNIFELGQYGGPLTIKANGVMIFDGQKHEGQDHMPVWRQNTIVSDEGIFPQMMGDTNFFFGKNFEVTESKRDKGHHIWVSTESTGVGTVGADFGQNGTSELSVAHQGKVEYVDLPESIAMAELVGARDAVFVSGSMPSSTPLYELRNGKLSIIPLPVGTTGFRLLGADSIGDFLMEVQNVDPLLKGIASYPYRTKNVYVHRGQYFDFDKVLLGLNLRGATYGRPLGYVQMNPMDEEGNIVVTSREDNYQRVFLLRKQK